MIWRIVTGGKLSFPQGMDFTISSRVAINAQLKSAYLEKGYHGLSTIKMKREKYHCAAPHTHAVCCKKHVSHSLSPRLLFKSRVDLSFVMIESTTRRLCVANFERF